MTAKFSRPLRLLLAATALLSAAGLASAVLRPENALASTPPHAVRPMTFVAPVERPTSAVVVSVTPGCDTDGLTVLAPDNCS